MDEVNTLNIPAYQRKRSINAQEKRIEKNKIRLSSVKKTKPSGSRKRPEEMMEIPIQEISPDEDLLETLRMPKVRESEIVEMKICGICESYFDKIEVAVIRLTSPLREGDKIIIEKWDGLFQQKVRSMQIDRKSVTLARSGSEIGLKTAFKPKVGGNVYKIIQ